MAYINQVQYDAVVEPVFVPDQPVARIPLETPTDQWHRPPPRAVMTSGMATIIAGGAFPPDFLPAPTEIDWGEEYTIIFPERMLVYQAVTAPVTVPAVAAGFAHSFGTVIG